MKPMLFCTPNKNNLPAKIVWKTLNNQDNRKIFETFSVNKGIIGDVFVKISEYPSNNHNLFIEIRNRLGKKLGHELFSMDKENPKNIFGFDINVENDYRKTKFRIGELLRLGSIMEMMENNSRHIKIFSKNTAVYFHAKYKFEPDITIFQERNNILHSIIADKHPDFKDLNFAAQKLLNEAFLTKDNPANQRNLCARTNALTKEYLERAIAEGKPEKYHPFRYGFYMILKNETVKHFRDYFNAIFKHQGIDYKIPEK